jgi:hypothetical protein
MPLRGEGAAGGDGKTPAGGHHVSSLTNLSDGDEQERLLSQGERRLAVHVDAGAAPVVVSSLAIDA